METFKEIISHQFTWGLIIGLALLFFSWRSFRKDRKYLKNEISRLITENAELQTHLGTQLKINAKGNESLQEQLDELRVQNETLRVNNHSLQQKPGKAEQLRFEVMERAVSIMREQAPGFAPAWEKAMAHSEKDMEEAESGLKKLIKKVVPGFKTIAVTDTKEDPKLIEVEKED